ncbi:MAG: hypothetical protein FD166_3620 [Bacteroidetes bacterium]|nr:MAG: hypothetical protein FD166_3620 [Bacteroidota bacterium]
MKQPIAAKLMFSIKTIQKAYFMLTNELMTEEDVKSKFFDREPMEIDFEKIDPDQELAIALAFTASMISME